MITSAVYRSTLYENARDIIVLGENMLKYRNKIPMGKISMFLFRLHVVWHKFVSSAK